MTSTLFAPAEFTEGGQAYMDAIADRVVVFDGAMGTSVQNMDVTAADFGSDDLDGCNEILGVTRPDVVRAIHDSFLEVGVDVIETNTFGANAVPLAEYSLEDRVEEINLANVRIAREAADHWTETTGQRRFVAELGVKVVGGCCGTTPDHLRAVVDAVRELEPAERTPVHEPGAASIYSHVPFDQDTSYLIIGERTNANGSKKFREAMLEGDIDTCVQMAKDQVKEGAHVIDLCVDYVGRDGVADMDAVAARFATEVTAPVVLDSTEPEVMEAGLRRLGGRSVLNSANLEEGDAEGSRLDRVFRLAKAHGAAVICLCIDEEGQARTADWKVRVAHRF